MTSLDESHVLGLAWHSFHLKKDFFYEKVCSHCIWISRQKWLNLDTELYSVECKWYPDKQPSSNLERWRGASGKFFVSFTCQTDSYCVQLSICNFLYFAESSGFSEHLKIVILHAWFLKVGNNVHLHSSSLTPLLRPGLNFKILS